MILLTTLGVYVCGHNKYHKFGIDNISIKQFERVDLDGIIEIYEFHNITVFVTINGIYACGTDNLGFLKPHNNHPLPVKLDIDEIKHISSNEDCIIYSTSDTTYGHGWIRRFGFDQSYFTTIPREVPLKNVIHVDCAYGHTLFFTEDAVYGCGDNYNYVLGVGQRYHLDNIELIFTGKVTNYFTCSNCTILITNDGVYASGSNAFGQLGLGKKTYVDKFTKLEIENVISISGSKYHLIFVTENGTFGSGSNYSGMLGLGSIKKINKFTRLNVENVISAYHIKNRCTLFLTTNGVFGCGDNKFGNIGINQNSHILTPVRINLENVYHILHRCYTVFISTDGVFGCGKGSHFGYDNIIFEPIRLPFKPEDIIISQPPLSKKRFGRTKSSKN